MCRDRSTNVRYPCHAEYVGTNSLARGRCERCGEITDPQLAAAADREIERQRLERERFKRHMVGPRN